MFVFRGRQGDLIKMDPLRPTVLVLDGVHLTDQGRLCYPAGDWAAFTERAWCHTSAGLLRLPFVDRGFGCHGLQASACRAMASWLVSVRPDRDDLVRYGSS